MCLLPFGFIHVCVDRPAPSWKDPALTGRPQDLDFGGERESWPCPVAAVPTDVSLWLSVSLPPEWGHSGQDCSGEGEELRRADGQREWLLQRPEEKVKETRGLERDGSELEAAQPPALGPSGFRCCQFSLLLTRVWVKLATGYLGAAKPATLPHSRVSLLL